VPTEADKISAYANPDMLVTTEWLADHLEDANVAVIESNEDVLLYDTGHIPGAIKIDWHTDLQDPVTRDYLDGQAFAALMDKDGITRDTTVVFYGDNFNWWAAYALWVFTLFGHEQLKLVDGGRAKWVAEGRSLTKDKPSRLPSGKGQTADTSGYPVVDRNDSPIRAMREDVHRHLRDQGPLVDVRSPEEYSGEKLHMPDYPQEGAMRGGHIPGAANVPWKRAAADDGTFKPLEELQEIYLNELSLSDSDDIIAYCRIGERSSHTWFVLHHLLGLPNVRNYDGSWTEWGNLVRAPIERPGFPVTPPIT
jgi:thiosulfate/3-mercaptopyruvate sulfurtransferase